MNPIQVNCPGCQKLYFVRPEDLSPGESLFKCTACAKMFAFNWPQAPEVTKIPARLVKDGDIKGVIVPSNPAKRVCVRCGEKVEAKYTECPKCGIIFERAKKPQKIDPIARGATPELAAGWDAVKANYGDEPRHEAFIQLCMTRENLAYASTQYRNVLDANPSEDIANRMQNRIIELATLSYITTQTGAKTPKPYSGIAKIMTVISGIIIATGIFITPARPMIAVGASILVFIGVSKYFGK